MGDKETEKELEIIFKNRNFLERKYYEYLCDRAMRERYFRIGGIEFSFRKAIVYWKEPEYPYNYTQKVILSFDFINELENNNIPYEINDLQFYIKYDEDYKVLKLSRLSEDGKVYMYIEKEKE